jgi:hypothetical protein
MGLEFNYLFMLFRYLFYSYYFTFKNVITQPAVRRVLPLIVMLFVLVVFGLTYAVMQTTPYRPVMPGLLEADQQAAFEALKKAEKPAPKAKS